MSNPLPTPPHAPQPRPALPALRLAVAPRKLGPSAIVAIVAHVIVIGAVIWERTNYLQGAMGGDGRQGGGGGGGEQLRYVTLPTAAAGPKAVETPQAPVPETPLPIPQALKLPEPTQVEITPVAITPPVVTVLGSGQGTGGGPGEVAGTGGGSGTTTGTGTGSNEGPGSGGGDGSDIIPADPKAALLPPDCVRGRFSVLLSVEANGRVSGVQLDPQPKDAACRREFVARMRGYEFRPARTRDGRSVASVFTVKIEH